MSPVSTGLWELSTNNLTSRLLPVKENFLTRQIFTNSSVLTKDDIGRVFCLYDRVSAGRLLLESFNTFLIVQDSSGQIENEELSGFLKDLLELVKNVGDDRIVRFRN